jgi:hypothetical protein
MTSPTRHAVDEAITQAARERTVVDPAPGLRERVLETIDALDTSARLPWARLALPLASAAALLLIAAAWLTGPSPMPSIGRPSPTLDARIGSPIEVASLAPIAAPVGRVSTATAPRPADEVERSAESETARLWRERAIPALPRPDPLAVDRIQPERVDLHLLEVAPLTTTRLELAPLIPGRPSAR